MKTIILIISLIFYTNIKSQVKVKSTLEFETGGSTVFYNVGVGTYLNFKNGTNFGLKLGFGYYPDIWFNKTSRMQVLPIQFVFNPSKFINGKFAFRAGSTFYFQQFIPNKQDGIIVYTGVGENQTLNSFNLGITYNVLKPNSRLFLSPGFDVVMGMRDLSTNNIAQPSVVPIPLIQFGVKLN